MGANMPLPEEIERDVLAELLTDDEAERSGGDARRQHQTPEERAKSPNLIEVDPHGQWMEEDHHFAYGADLEGQHAAYRKAQSRADTRPIEGDFRVFLRRKGVTLDPTSPEYRSGALAYLKATVQAYALMLERQKGEPITTPAPSAGRGPKLSEAFAAWKAGSGARGGKKPASNTVLEAEYAVRRLKDWHGDIRLADLTREKARDFRDALERVPTRLPDRLRRLPLRELHKLDLSAYPPAHAATVNKSLTLLAAIVVHAEMAGKFDGVPEFKNPFGKGIKLPVDARAEEQRQAFTSADLKAIFGTGVYAKGDRPAGGGGEAAFWLPLLALLTGARQGELAQLRVADLAQDAESRIWHLDIGTAGGRSIKTASSRRKVPLHPALESIGLLRYRQALVDGGTELEAPLWPKIEADQAGRQSGPWSKWFNRYLRDKAGIEDRTKVFHSFRHSFKELARGAELGEEVHDALTGHAGGGVGRRYGGFGLKVLAEAVARLEVPESVRGLRWASGAGDKNR